MYQVFINGYGIIGSRLATALTKDKSINLIGIAKYSVDEKTQEAINKGYKVFVPRKLMKDFQNKKYDISGSIEDAINQSDLVIEQGHNIFGLCLSLPSAK